MTDDVLARAYHFLARGFSVIPVPPPIPGTPPNTPGDGKTPALKWKRFQSARPTAADIERWFRRAPMNLAIITGAISGVVVVDADSGEALRWCTSHLPYTPLQTRTAKGYHFYFQHPGTVVRNRARLQTGDGRLLIDVRGDGGYVVGPGSLHMSGVHYREAGDWSEPRDRVPIFDSSWLQLAAATVATGPAARPRIEQTGDVVDRARRYLDAIPRPDIGSGSDAATLYAACRLVRGFGLSAADAERLLWDWAGGRPGWTRGWVAAKVIAAEKYGTEPVGALR